MRPYYESPVKLSAADLRMIRIQRHLRGQAYISMVFFGFIALLILAAAGFWIGLLAALILLAYPTYTLTRVERLAAQSALVAIHPGEAFLNEFRYKRSRYRINFHYRFEGKDYVVKKEIDQAVHQSVVAGAFTLEGVIDRKKPGKLVLWNIGDGTPLPDSETDSTPRNLPHPATTLPASASSIGPLHIALGVVMLMAVGCMIWLASGGGPQRPVHWTNWEMFGSNAVVKKDEVTYATRNAPVEPGRPPVYSKLLWRIGTEASTLYHLEFQNQDVAKVSFTVWANGTQWGKLTIAPGQTDRVSKQFSTPLPSVRVELTGFQYLEP